MVVEGERQIDLRREFCSFGAMTGKALFWAANYVASYCETFEEEPPKMTGMDG